jgi:hypothetical protein
MAANGISTLANKQLRQAAKLAKATAKRQGKTVAVDGTITGSTDDTKPYYRAANTLDINLLPTKYNVNGLTDNPNHPVGGVITSITIATPLTRLDGGNYLTPANVSIQFALPSTGGGYGSNRATGTPVITNGKLSGITIVSGGSGYVKRNTVGILNGQVQVDIFVIDSTSGSPDTREIADIITVGVDVSASDIISVGLVQGRPWSTTNPDTAITVIETAASGATLILNLDSRNTNSLARTASPGTWNDLTANNNHATIYGTVAYGSLGGQNCAVFPGGNENYAQALSGAYFTGTSFTVQSWVYVTAVLNWNRIFDFGNGSSSNNVLLANSYGTSGKPGIYIEGQQFQSTLAGSSSVLLNAWHQICCTFNYVSGPNGTATIYVDGQPAGAGTLPKPVNIVRNNCYIGRSNWGFGDPNMQGGIGSLQIYNGLLSDAEMLSNYNTTKSYYGL